MTPTTEALVTSTSDVVRDLFWMLFDRSVIGYFVGAFSGVVFALSTIVFLYLASFVVTRLWRAWNFCASALETLSSAWDFYLSLIEKVSSALNSEEFEMFQHIFDKAVNSINNNEKKQQQQQEEHLPPWLERVEGRPGNNNAGVFRLVPHCECVDGICENNTFDLPKPPAFRAQPYKVLPPHVCCCCHGCCWVSRALTTRVVVLWPFVFRSIILHQSSAARGTRLLLPFFPSLPSASTSPLLFASKQRPRPSPRERPILSRTWATCPRCLLNFWPSSLR
ncbi:hypothetical protein [Mollivirus kamchatka]|nr:hypothetical protein [Mollivirus kamchatka]